MISFYIVISCIVVFLILSVVQQWIIINKMKKDKEASEEIETSTNTPIEAEEEQEEFNIMPKVGHKKNIDKIIEKKVNEKLEEIREEHREERDNDEKLLKKYDYKKLYDPLEEPRSRPSKQELGPIGFRRYIGIATQGYPDNFHLLGTLTTEEHDIMNKILKLYGREKYPRSVEWEYYTMISTGNDMIKIPLKSNNNNREVYDDDEFYIPELNRTYKVRLYPKEDLRYNPNVFF